MENKIDWLPGGPYYELSLILKNCEDMTFFINYILDKLPLMSNRIIYKNSIDTINNMISDFIIKKEPIDLNVEIEVDINRKSRIFIEPMSKEFLLVDLWFLGSIFEEKPIIKSNKHFFRNFLDELFIKLDAVCATINYESDCRYLFLIDSYLPDDRYNLSSLNYGTIIKQLYFNKFEYAILGKEVTKKEIEWLFISDDDIEW